MKYHYRRRRSVQVEKAIMLKEIRDIARQRYNLDGIENERMLHNIVRNIAYDPRFERQDFIDPDTGRFLGSDYCHVKMKEQYRYKDFSEY